MVRVRQRVLSLPLPLRVPLAWHHDLALAVHAIAMRAIEGWYRARDAKTGSITVVQRFGSDLALNVHFHSLVLDGVYGAAGAFHETTTPEWTPRCATAQTRTRRPRFVWLGSSCAAL